MPATRDLRRRNELARDVFPAVRRFCQKYAHPTRAEDLAQSAMLTIILAADRIGPDAIASPRSWAFGVARHVVMRRERRRPVPFSVVEGDDGDPLDPADHRAATDAATPATPSDLVRVRELLLTLPPADGELLRLRFLLGLSPVEVAAKLLLTPTQVTARVGRLLRALRAEVRR